MRNDLELAVAPQVTHSLKYVSFRRPSDSPHLFTIFEYLRNEELFEKLCCVRHQAAFFVNHQNVDISASRLVIMRRSSFAHRFDGILMRRHDCSLRLRLRVSAYYAVFTRRAERCSLLFRIGTAKPCVFSPVVWLAYSSPRPG